MQILDKDSLKNLINYSTCPAAHKDLNSVFTYANSRYAEIVELSHGMDVVGRKSSQMPARTSECAELIDAQDRKVIFTGKSLSIFGVHPNAMDELKVYQFIKTPNYNADENISGILIRGGDITSAATLELGKFLQKIPIESGGRLLTDNSTYIIGKEHAEIQISDQEHEILFYILRGIPNETVVNMLNIHLFDIENGLLSLRTKFGCNTTSEMKDHAMEKGFINILPPSIFSPAVIRALSSI